MRAPKLPIEIRPVPSLRPIVTVPVAAKFVVSEVEEICTVPEASLIPIVLPAKLPLKNTLFALIKAPRVIGPAAVNVALPPNVRAAEVVIFPNPLKSLSAVSIRSALVLVPKLIVAPVLTMMLLAAESVRSLTGLPVVFTALATVMFPA